jgi:hypothetical protein
LEVFLTVQGAENEGSGQFRMDTRSSLNLAYLEGSIIKKIQKKSSGLEEPGLHRKPSGTKDLANLHWLAAGDGDAAVDRRIELKVAVFLIGYRSSDSTRNQKWRILISFRYFFNKYQFVTCLRLRSRLPQRSLERIGVS